MSQERKIASINFAQESAKQIIALCTAILTLLAGAIAVDAIEIHGAWFLLLSGTFFVLIVSVSAGVLTLYSLAGVLASGTEFAKDNPLDSHHYKVFGRIQFGSFLAAIALIAVVVLWQPHKSSPGTTFIWPNSISCSWKKNDVICRTKN